MQRAFAVRLAGLVVLLSFCACFAAPGSYENPEPRKNVTVQFLMESCSSVGQSEFGMIPFFDCQSFVYGTLNTYISVRDLIPKDKRACFPDALSPWQAMKDVFPLLINSKGANAGEAIIEALKVKYPC